MTFANTDLTDHDCVGDQLPFVIFLGNVSPHRHMSRERGDQDGQQRQESCHANERELCQTLWQGRHACCTSRSRHRRRRHERKIRSERARHAADQLLNAERPREDGGDGGNLRRCAFFECIMVLLKDKKSLSSHAKAIGGVDI